jgi:ABC-2 type transport system permease protein
MKVLEIARVNMLRTMRNRIALFFIVIFPMVLIVVLGMTYGGMGAGRVGVADADGGPLARDLVARLKVGALNLDVRTYDTPDALRDAVERGFVNVGLAIPAGYDARLRDGGDVTLEYLSQPSSVSSVVRTSVDAAIAGHVALVRAARFTAAQRSMTFDAALAAAEEVQPQIKGVTVVTDAVSEAAAYPSGFTVGAQSQVILFMFLTSLTQAVVLITSRQLGVTRREFATPTSVRTIIAGEALGRYAFALFQGFLIVIGSALIFGVDWADPLATTALIVVFGAVCAGAAMLVGAVAANASQAGAFGPALGMLGGLLGGAMVPLEVFPATLRTVAHITPHAWALDAFRELSLQGGHLLDIVPQLAVLVGMAVVLLGLAVWRLRQGIVVGAG